MAQRRNKSNPDDRSDDGVDAETIDVVLQRLQGVVAELEGGDLPLEQALVQFEQGVVLARKGSAMLDRVEERVEMLLADRDETVPLTETDED